MVTDAELEGFRNDRYLARSWALLTREKGWYKPVLVLMAAQLVPVAGALGVSGYIYEWSRFVAWGSNAGPKRSGVKVGECIATGFRGFVVALVWGLCMGVVTWAVSRIDFLAGLWGIACVFLNLVVMVCILRATVYQRIVPGLRVRTIWEMVKHDATGLVRILGIRALFDAIIGLVAFVVCIGSLISVLPDFVYAMEAISYYEQMYYDTSMVDRYMLELVAQTLLALGPAIIVLVLVCGFANVAKDLVSYAAMGLWMRQFNVAAWGRDEDPLPPFVSDPREGAAWNAYGYVPSAPGQQPQVVPGWQAGQDQAENTAGWQPVPEPAPEQRGGGVGQPAPEQPQWQEGPAGGDAPAQPWGGASTYAPFSPEQPYSAPEPAAPAAPQVGAWDAAPVAPAAPVEPAAPAASAVDENPWNGSSDPWARPVVASADEASAPTVQDVLGVQPEAQGQPASEPGPVPESALAASEPETAPEPASDSDPEPASESEGEAMPEADSEPEA